MKFKTLLVLVLTMTVVFGGVAYAAKGQTGGGVPQANQIAQQQQTKNQGEDIQIQTQNQNQEQIGTITQAGQQKPAQLQAGEPGENEPKQEQNMNQLRQSEVANAVHELLDVANRVGGIGEQVRVIAQTQQQNQTQIEVSVEKIQKQNKVTTFLIGPNHGEINKAAKLTVQNEEKIAELKALQMEMADQVEIQKTTEQIQVLEKANLEVKTTLTAVQKTFSLFG